ncbi:MAG: hypothetical protein IKJ48_00420, partial [Alistipes sp.]|nr:hypothetical protein [Alistipes sp.]
MKKILLAISMMFALTACISEDLPQPQQTDGDNIELNFSVTIPEAGPVTRGTLGGPKITSLTVVVFDDKGYFVAARSANPTNGWGEKVTSAETPFTVALPQSSSPRILHFVANKSPEDFAFGTETAIMTELTTSLRASGDTDSNEDAYWQRVEVPNLLEQDKNTLSTTLKKIPLVRNFAKIKIGTVPSGFTVTGFALINTPTSGTVAPYNVNEGCFEPYWKASGDNKVGKDYSDLKDANYDAFMPVNVALGSRPTSTGDGDLTYSPYKNTDNTDGALYTYESSYKNQTAVIIKGRISTATSDTYYKVELYDATNGNYDVLRNVEYTINIDNVVGEGYSTAKEAADNVGGNNISNSIATQSLLNISDGTQRLYVEYTSKRVMEASTPFTLKYRFTTNGKATNVTYNNKITTSGSESEVNGYLTITRKTTSEDGTAVLTAVNTTGHTTQDSDGWSILTLTPQAQMPDGNKVWSEDLIITSKCNGVTLSRTVKLYMLNPYVMEVVCNPSEVADNDINQPVTVNTNIPANLPSDIFPLVFDIEAAKLSLYPDPDATDVLGHTIVMPVVSGPSIIPSSSKNSFYYQRTLTYAEYEKLVENAGGATTVAIPSYFLTNMKNSATKVYVHNNYFGTIYGAFDNYTAESFSDITWSVNINRYGAGQTGKLEFKTTDTSEITVTLNGVRRASDDKITFTLSEATSYTIDIETVDWNTTPSVTLTGNGYITATSTAPRNILYIPAENIKTDFTDDSVTLYVNGSSTNKTSSFESGENASAYEYTIENLAANATLYLRYSEGWGWPTTYY